MILHDESPYDKNQRVYLDKMKRNQNVSALLQNMQHNIQNQIEKGHFQIKQNLKASSLQKIKTQSSTLDFSPLPLQFITIKTDRLLIQQQQQKKRLRIKQYIERLKLMSPDQNTLERIKKVKEQMILNQRFLQRQIKQKTQRKIKNRVKLVETPVKNNNENEKHKQKRIYGKQYLNDQNKYRRVKTETKVENIQEKTQETQREVYEATKVKRHQMQRKRIQTEKSLPSFKKKFTQSSTQQPSTPSKLSVKNSKNQHFFTLPLISEQKRSQSQKSIQKRKQYKNYLLDLKLKPIKPLSDLQKVKREIKYPAQVMREFNKRSLSIEKTMMQQIKEYRKLQQKDKYEKGLLKESQIDELFHKNLELKLACLTIS